MTPIEKLARIHQKTGWTQTELAQRLHISRRQMIYLQTEKRNITPDHRQTIDDLFKHVISRSFRMVAKSPTFATVWFWRFYTQMWSKQKGHFTPDELAAISRAYAMADPRGGNDWGRARRMLTRAGFVVTWT